MTEVTLTTDSELAGSTEDAEDKHDPADYFVEGRGGKLGPLKVTTLARAVEQPIGKVRSGPDAGLYRYDHGIYRAGGEEAIRYGAQGLLGYLTKNRHVSEVVRYFENRGGLDPLSFDPPRGRIIYAKNGILHLSTDPDNPVERIEPYTPDNAWLARVPWEYQADAPAPEGVMRFLHDSFVTSVEGEWASDEDSIAYMLALVGLGMVPRNVLRRAILLHGKGHNGKSIFLHLVRALMGAENVGAVSLEALSSNRFAAAELRGKLANVCGDISSNGGTDSSLFKQMTGDDPIYGERKFGQPFTFYCGAMPFWSCNVYPRSADTTPAFMSRWAVYNFQRQFEENAETEADLKALAEDEAEMTGLFAWVVRNAVWLLAENRPTTDAVPEAMRNAKTRFLQNTDTVKAFVDEAFIAEASGRVGGKDAYGWYAQFCDAAGMRQMGRNKFYERLEAQEGIDRTTLSNKLYFTGVRLDETWTAESGPQTPDFDMAGALASAFPEG